MKSRVTIWICCVGAVLLVCHSCTKKQIDQINAGYHINFKMDGIQETFDQNDSCQLTWDRSGNPPMENLSIRGHKSAEALQHAPIIELAIVSVDSITVGSYTDSSSNDAYSVFADYIPLPDIQLSQGDIYMAGDGVYTDGIQQGVQLTHHLTINVTSIENGTIKGTFNGDFYEYDSDIRQAKITSITDGEFYLKIQ